MGFKPPQEIAVAVVDAGSKKAYLSSDRMLVGGFLAGAYIAFAGLLAVVVSSGLNVKTWGTLPTLFTGTVFAMGLVLVVVAGAELVTGNMALVPMASMHHKAPLGLVAKSIILVTIGNLLGSLVVAYFLAVKSGVIGGPHATGAAALTHDRLAAIATGKASTETNTQIFLRAIGCNWLVCLAVWMATAAEDIAGKILAIFFPIMGFVAMGFDHVVANMFFLPAAIFAGVDTVTWGGTINNWGWAFLGNFVGAAIFVSFLYWWLYLRGTDAVSRATGEQEVGDVPPGREAGSSLRGDSSSNGARGASHVDVHREGLSEG
ncbi:MAG: formate/nitrite transporter family protein [Actinomycetales bacterium]